MSINDKLKAFFASSEGKKKVAELRAQGRIGGKYAIPKEQYRPAVDDLIACIKANLPDSLRSSELMDDNSYLVSKARRQKDGSIRIDIRFAPDAVFRPSLDPTGPWGEGVENIVLHLSNGWHAAGTVTGEWHGRQARSRQVYEGDSFMQDAVFDFNMSHIGVTAELGSQYKKVVSE